MSKGDQTAYYFVAVKISHQFNFEIIITPYEKQNKLFYSFFKETTR